MASNLFAYLIFGLFGMAAFMYGKKQQKPKAMLIAGALIAYPYAVSDTFLLWGIGIALTVALFIFRD